jgi:hypothetical protein
MMSPHLVFPAEEGEYWPCLQTLVSKGKLRGPAVHCRNAALCRLHGLQELWTADRDFSRMDLKVRNPLLG